MKTPTYEDVMLRLPEDTLEAAKEDAAKHRITLSMYVAEAIRAFVSLG